MGDLVMSEFMVCPECGRCEWVSPEDPDASFSQLLRHIRSRHPLVDQSPSALWPRIETMEAPDDDA